MPWVSSRLIIMRLNLFMLGNFARFFVICGFFVKLTFKKKKHKYTNSNVR